MGIVSQDTILFNDTVAHNISYGLPEARIDEMASPILGNENPYVGIYAKEDGIHIRAIAKAKNPYLMARAMRKAVESGREAFLAGRMEKVYLGSASSPSEGLIK